MSARPQDRYLHDAVVPDLRQWIRPGDTVAWGQGNAEPQLLTRALAAQRSALGGVRCFVGVGAHETFNEAMRDSLSFVSYCGSGTNRRFAGALDILPSSYSEIAKLIRMRHLRIDVLMLKVSPSDELGRYSWGLACEYLVAAREAARAVLVQVDSSCPWTYGERFMLRDDFALLVKGDEPPAQGQTSVPSDVESAIGAHIASLVEDGATLQTGIGGIPDAVLAALHGHRDLGLHTGAAGDGIVRLAEAGALTNAKKSLDNGVSVAGVLLGSGALSKFAHRNPRFHLRRTEYTHDAQVLAAQHKLVAINSAIEVDLTGQINAEVAAGRYLGAVGGGAEFLRGARQSRGGVPIIALPSTAAGRSRITACLSGPVTIARSDAGVIVTEHGVADLRGLSLSRRAERMIGIAAPEHRDQLGIDAERLLRGASTRRPD